MEAQQKLKALLDQLNTVIVGKPAQVQDCVACLLAGGHLLIEDVPGRRQDHPGACAGARFGLQFSRVQFTADLMPSDLSASSSTSAARKSFVFHPGPVFAQVLLADEINRASPKTQSALLEAMEEQQVTVEGETRALPSPFFVIATQNPHDQLGTFALPESQLDRFLMRISLGYPDRAAERELLAGADRREHGRAPAQHADAGRAAAAAAAGACRCMRPTRCSTTCRTWSRPPARAAGSCRACRPRAGIAVVRAAKAQALLSGRDYVAPDDVQAVLPQTVAHRLVPVGDAGRGPVEQVRAMMEAVPLP